MITWLASSLTLSTVTWSHDQPAFIERVKKVEANEIYRERQSHLYFLRRLGSFDICRKVLKVFSQTVFGLDRLRRAGSDVHRAGLTGNCGSEENPWEENPLSTHHHPLHYIFITEWCVFSGLCPCRAAPTHLRTLYLYFIYIYIIIDIYSIYIYTFVLWFIFISALSCTECIF